jgi:uncharacterized protein (TIGR02757 family)
MGVDKRELDRLYEKYNRREFVHPDPLEFLYEYPEPADREIVGLIASSLAYGRVAQILKSVASVLSRMEKPGKFVREATVREMEEKFAGFKHRFTTAEEMVGMLRGVRRVLEEYGSLERCFVGGLRKEERTVQAAATRFSRVLTGGEKTSLLPMAEGKSACKRMHLFLRWMVRKDAVDPGGWEGVSAERLVVPLDTHMHRMGLEMGLTERKQADSRTAEEITEGFRRIEPRDAVKYDFTLTRFGIWRRRDLAKNGTNEDE